MSIRRGPRAQASRPICVARRVAHLNILARQICAANSPFPETRLFVFNNLLGSFRQIKLLRKCAFSGRSSLSFRPAATSRLVARGVLDFCGLAHCAPELGIAGGPELCRRSPPSAGARFLADGETGRGCLFKGDGGFLRLKHQALKGLPLVSIFRV